MWTRGASSKERRQWRRLGHAIFDAICKVAAGTLTAAEVLGHEEYCIPYKHQDLYAMM